MTVIENQKNYKEQKGVLIILKWARYLAAGYLIIQSHSSWDIWYLTKQLSVSPLLKTPKKFNDNGFLNHT